MWGYAVVVVTLATLTVITAAANDYDFSSYMVKYGKKYTTEVEFQHRRRVYLYNMNYIRKHNHIQTNSIHPYLLGENNFTDMTNDEFRKTMNGYRYRPNHPQSNRNLYERKIRTLPTEVNWVAEGYVTPIKNQGQCGSCWAFSSTGSLEGQHYNATKRLVSLSEQNLMDCSWSYGNFGCGGGWMDNSFKYVIANTGLDTEAGYPYYRVAYHTCRFYRGYVGSNCVGYRDIPTGSEADLQAAVAEIGPISVAIDATHPSFQSYRSGVYYEPYCGNQLANLDHAVLVVGFGIEAGREYWLVKNSWGTWWGEAGYIKMSRNMNNQCGIATKASYPIVTA